MNENILKFKINKITLLSTWCHNLQNNTDCTICRTNLNCNSIYAKDKESIVVSGMCGHSFHNECIESWLNPTNGFSNKQCPICSTKWVYKK